MTFQSLLRQGTSSNAIQVQRWPGRVAISIPSSSGHFFEPNFVRSSANGWKCVEFQSLLRQGTSSNLLSAFVLCSANRSCFNPFFVRALLRTLNSATGLTTEESAVSIPSSSGHFFELTKLILPSQRFSRSFNPFFVRALLRTLCTRSLAMCHLCSFNPFFVRALLRTHRKLGCRRNGHGVSIPFSSGHFFEQQRSTRCRNGLGTSFNPFFVRALLRTDMDCN